MIIDSDNRIHIRRKACHDEQQFSKDSLVSAMENFVKTVSIMNETILVPCRLMDRQIGDDLDKFQNPNVDTDNNPNDKNGIELKSIHENLKSADLFNLFNILNATKNDLLWTGNETIVAPFRNDILCLETNDGTTTNSAIITNSDNDQLSSQTNIQNNTLNETLNVKGHQRRPSTASISSIASISDLTSDFSAENDSGIESESQNGNVVKNDDITKIIYSVKSDKASELSKQCKFHLFGLYQCLQQMTEAANYLTTRYQSDVGSV